MRRSDRPTSSFQNGSVSGLQSNAFVVAVQTAVAAESIAT